MLANESLTLFQQFREGRTCILSALARYSNTDCLCYLSEDAFAYGFLGILLSHVCFRFARVLTNEEFIHDLDETGSRVVGPFTEHDRRFYFRARIRGSTTDTGVGGELGTLFDRQLLPISRDPRRGCASNAKPTLDFPSKTNTCSLSDPLISSSPLNYG